MSNKKIITIILAGVLAVSILGGCAKKEDKKEAAARQTGVQATKEEVQKADVKTEDGKAVGDKVQEKAAKVDKNTDLLLPLTEDFVKTMYNFTPDTLKASVDKMNSKSLREGGFWGTTNTAKYIENNKNNTDVLKDYKVNEVTFDIPITDPKTNTVYNNCATVDTTINYVENGKEATDNIIIAFAWDTKTNTWKQLDLHTK